MKKKKEKEEKTNLEFKSSLHSVSDYTGTFKCECEFAIIYEQSLVILPNSGQQNSKLLVCTFQGTIKQNLDCDGQPIAIHLNNCYLVAATIIGMLQIWDLSRRYVLFTFSPQ